jgi:hypothetical protein
VLQLDLEQPDHLHRDPGGAGDPDAGVVVGREDLLDLAVGDQVAHRGPAVAAHQDAAVEGERHDGGGVRHLRHGHRRQVSPGGQQMVGVRGQEVREGRRSRGQERRWQTTVTCRIEVAHATDPIRREAAVTGRPSERIP